MRFHLKSILHAKRISAFMLTTMFLLGATQVVQAQPMQQQQQSVPTPSDEELELFVEAVQEVQPLQQESQEKMVKKIQEKDLTVQEYNEIMQANQNPEAGSDVSAQKEQAFNAASRDIQSIQQEYEQKIENKVEETGLGMQKYRQIMMAYQQDPEVQSKVNDLMQQ